MKSGPGLLTMQLTHSHLDWLADYFRLVWTQTFQTALSETKLTLNYSATLLARRS